MPNKTRCFARTDGSGNAENGARPCIPRFECRRHLSFEVFDLRPTRIHRLPLPASFLFRVCVPSKERRFEIAVLFGSAVSNRRSLKLATVNADPNSVWK